MKWKTVVMPVAVLLFLLPLLQSEAIGGGCSATSKCKCVCNDDSVEDIGEVDVPGEHEHWYGGDCCADNINRAAELCRDRKKGNCKADCVTPMFEAVYKRNYWRIEAHGECGNVGEVY